MQISSNINMIQNQMSQLNSNATELSSVGLVSENTNANESSDATRVLTDNISLENGLDAQINSIKTQDEMIGNTLDIVG